MKKSHFILALSSLLFSASGFTQNLKMADQCYNLEIVPTSKVNISIKQGIKSIELVKNNDKYDAAFVYNDADRTLEERLKYAKLEFNILKEHKLISERDIQFFNIFLKDIESFKRFYKHYIVGLAADEAIRVNPSALLQCDYSLSMITVHIVYSMLYNDNTQDILDILLNDNDSMLFKNKMSHIESRI